MLATKTKNLLFADILTISRKNMENFDTENLSEDEKQQYSLMRRMYASSYIMLLRNGLSFYTDSDSWKEADSVFLSVNGEVYDFSVPQIKNLLGKKEAEALLSQSFSSEQKDYVFDTEKTKRLNISRYMSAVPSEKEEPVKQDVSEKQTLKEEPAPEEKEEKEAPVPVPFSESEGAEESPPKKKKKKKKKKHPAETLPSEEALSEKEESPEEKEEPLIVETFIEEEILPAQESVQPEPVKETVQPEPAQNISSESVKEAIEPEPVQNISPEPVKETVQPEPAQNISPESAKENIKSVKESVKLDISDLQKKHASEKEERSPEASPYDERAYARQTASEKEQPQKDSYRKVLSGRSIKNPEEESSKKDLSKENREKPHGFSTDETFEDIMPETKPSASPVPRAPRRARFSAPSAFEEPEEPKEETSYKTDEDHFIDINELLMDSFKIKVFSIDDKEKKTPLETFTIVAAPLKEGRDNAFLPIFSYAASKSSVSAMASSNSTRPSYEIQLDENVFVIRGKWNADGFSTILYPQNFFNKETQTEKKVFRPASQSIGHNINILEDSLKMHVLPISSRNEKSGNVNILVCLEDTKNDKFAPAFSDAETSVATVVYNKKTYAVTASWKGRQLISSVEVK